MNDICFWMLRRRDTGEWYRTRKGSVWGKSENWVMDRRRGKVYGGVGQAKAARTAYHGDYGREFEVQLMRFRVVEEGVER